MTPLIRDAPPSLHCESDLHRAQIRMRKPRTGLGVLGAALMLCLNLSLLMPVASEEPSLWGFQLGMVVLLDLIWLWSRRGRTMHVTIDANILDVRSSPLGAHYRIPLHDIEAVRISDIKTRQRRLMVTLPDDQIPVGKGFSDTELSWLASVVRAAVKEARQRPAQREGMPDEVPRQLAALQVRPVE